MHASSAAAAPRSPPLLRGGAQPRAALALDKHGHGCGALALLHRHLALDACRQGQWGGGGGAAAAGARLARGRATLAREAGKHVWKQGRHLVTARGGRGCRAVWGSAVRRLTPLQQLLQAAVEVLGAGGPQPHVCARHGGGAEGQMHWRCTLCCWLLVIARLNSGIWQASREKCSGRDWLGGALCHQKAGRQARSRPHPSPSLTNRLQLAVQGQADLGLNRSRQLGNARVEGGKQLAACGWGTGVKQGEVRSSHWVTQPTACTSQPGSGCNGRRPPLPKRLLQGASPLPRVGGLLQGAPEVAHLGLHLQRGRRGGRRHAGDWQRGAGEEEEPTGTAGGQAITPGQG